VDEEANPERLPLYAIAEFMAHFRLTDEGIVELEGFAEAFGDHVRETKPAPESDTELGKRIKSQTDLPTSVINQHIQTTASEVLRKIKPKGKPN
jgi:hypothetical protein